jgi:hypothetical protein
MRPLIFINEPYICESRFRFYVTQVRPLGSPCMTYEVIILWVTENSIRRGSRFQRDKNLSKYQSYL